MSDILDCCEKIWSSCPSSISPATFYAVTENLQEQIDNIEASGLTYEEGDYIQIDGNVISVSGINPSDYALKSDLDELSGKVDTISGTIETIQQEIEDIETSALTYSAGTNIDITDKVISVTGIDTTHFATKEELATKQDTLVSGENVKTINGTSILGEGNIEIQGSVVVDQSLNSGSTNPVTNSAITIAINTISGNTDNKQDKLTATNFIDLTNNVISAKISVLTQAQWAALTTKDPNVIYLIKED